ncbi:MAG: asparagine synthase (glutamine-hydrolyzing) [Cyanobacteriota bacterium]
MIAKIKHRGPDGDGLWISNDLKLPALFCHTRLAILDLSSAASQPFVSADGRHVLVFNGEVYNFLELREELKAKGHRFSTASDTEVLLAGLIAEGPSFQLKCNGMWAFCLWDTHERTALFGRDRFGVKPLFYTTLSDGSLAFSSEMKGLTHLLQSVQPANGLDRFLTHQFEYEVTDECVIKGISRFPAGTSASFHDGRLHFDRWWNTLDHLVIPDVNYDDQVEHWRHLFIDAVRLRMRSDVRIGTALSGGLDSSSVLAAMRYVADTNSAISDRLSSDWQHGFCCRYPGSQLDESHWAKLVADSCDTPFSLVEINPLNSGWSLEDSLAQVEDPYLTIPLPMLATYKAIKEHGISVTLDGHGADELFSGYGHIRKALLCAASDSEYSEILSIDESTQTGVYSEKEKLRTKQRLRIKLKHWLSTTHSQARFWLGRSQYSQSLATIKQHSAYQAMDVFSQVLYELFHCSVLPTLLRNYDRYSMASGLEIRMPFMDWRLVTYTFSLPWRAKVGGSFSKRIQRDALRGILIDKVRQRRDKIGWNAPAHEWFRGPLCASVDTWLQSEDNGPYQKQAAHAWKVFQTIPSPGFSEGQKLWNELLPFLWLQSLKNERWH